MKKEGFAEIGLAIQNHRNLEKKKHIRLVAVARSLCTVKSTKKFNGTQQFWIINNEYSYNQEPLIGDGQPVYKNSKMGGIITMQNSGTHHYDIPSPYFKKNIRNSVDVTIHNKATYTPTIDSAKDINIIFAEDEISHRFSKLSELTSLVEKQNEELNKARQRKKEAEEKEKAIKEQEKAAAEKAAVDKTRLDEEEARKRAEAALQAKRDREAADAQIEQLEKDINESNQQIKERKNFIRQGNQLRIQHLLDRTQETAKRSHLFDGIPIIIEGGPGTGKTTTMIQRLKFLISEEALREGDAHLSNNQLHVLTDPTNRHNNWIFFSPTPLLLRFLRQNMAEEELKANQNNTTTLSDFRRSMLNLYMLINPEKDGPFKIFRSSEADHILIKQPIETIKDFENFIIKNITSILTAKANLPTSEFEWHSSANNIKEICITAANVKSVDSLMRLFDRLKDSNTSKVRAIEEDLRNLLNRKAIEALNLIKADEQLKSNIIKLFERWEDDIEPDDSDDIETDMDEAEIDEDENSPASMKEFEPKLYKFLKQLLRNISLKKYDSKHKIPVRQKEVYNIVKTIIDGIDIQKIGELAWFVKNFAFLCRGTESNILNQIPRLYKNFRRKQFENNSGNYNLNLLEKLIKHDENKRLHPDEQNLLIGFINNLLYSIYRQSRNRFENMKNQKYISAYRRNVKYVIGIDEATDYSILDYYFIVSFRHYEFSSVTLCGDIMQGLNSNGIKSWSELKDPRILPNLEICELATSYRQLPTLVQMSKQMFKDDQGSEAPYDSLNPDTENDPPALKFVSDDEDRKITWITKRIVEVNKFYNRDLPSVGIFIADDIDINEFVNLIKMKDNLGSINVVNGETSDLKQAVRVYHLSQVKGMEFEVVFFHNIDLAIKGNDTHLMRRHLYVGISRASSFLAATFSKEEGNEEILKYFSQDKTNWKF